MRLASGQAGGRGADLALGAEDHRREQVVVEVAPDAGNVGDDVDAERAQFVGGAHAREQEELRRADRATAQDHLVRVRAAARPFDADAAAAVEQEPAGGRAGHDLEVLAPLDRPHVRGRRALADAVLEVELHEGEAFLRLAVVVGIEGQSALLRGLGQGGVDRVGPERREESDHARAVRFAPLESLVHRPHVGPGPAFGAEVGPGVEILRGPAHPDHRVEATRAAEHLAARPTEPAPVRVRLRHCLVGPVHVREPQLVHPARVVDRGVLVAAAGLEEQHPHALIDEPAGEDPSRRARSHHDHIRVSHRVGTNITLLEDARLHLVGKDSRQAGSP
jgi:hypothetical protein